MRYQVLYKGVLAVTSLTRNGAYAKAGKLILDKGWDAREVKIVEAH